MAVCGRLVEHQVGMNVMLFKCSAGHDAGGLRVIPWWEVLGLDTIPFFFFFFGRGGGGGGGWWWWCLLFHPVHSFLGTVFSALRCEVMNTVLLCAASRVIKHKQPPVQMDTPQYKGKDVIFRRQGMSLMKYPV